MIIVVKNKGNDELLYTEKLMCDEIYWGVKITRVYSENWVLQFEHNISPYTHRVVKVPV